MNTTDPSPTFEPRCKYLRSKEMYYASYDQEESPFASGAFWCAKTQETFGPDGQPVSKSDCCTGRNCFVD